MDFNSIQPYVPVTYKFEQRTGSLYHVRSVETKEFIGFVCGLDLSRSRLPEDVKDAVLKEFDEFSSSFEASVSIAAEMPDSLNELKEAYDRRIIGICLMKYGEVGVKRAESVIKWLESTDFYFAPASTVYHDNFPGGLVRHSLKVFNHALELRKIDAFENTDVVSVALAALTHDWCKIDFYEKYQKNVKDEVTGTWEKRDAYKISQTGIPLGHGATSMFLASRFFSLTPDEALAIRWHMGEYNCSPNETSELWSACEKVPLVNLLQFADRLAVVSYT